MEEKEKNQKTVVAFIGGLIIGGLLVWVFSIAPEEKKGKDLTIDVPKAEEKASTEKNIQAAPTEAPRGETVAATKAGSLAVEDQSAGKVVKLASVEMPVENGWIVVHELNTDGTLANILGAARYSAAEGLTPSEVELLRGTTAGKTYKVVVYNENGDRSFAKASDVIVTTQDGHLVEDSFSAQ